MLSADRESGVPPTALQSAKGYFGKQQNGTELGCCHWNMGCIQSQPAPSSLISPKTVKPFIWPSQTAMQDAPKQSEWGKNEKNSSKMHFQGDPDVFSCRHTQKEQEQ